MSPVPPQSRARRKGLPRRKAPRTTHPAGTLLGPYRIGARIGTGGMADVYRVTTGEPGFERTFALKCMRVDTETGPEMAHLFADEARLSTRLHHPNVVQVFDVGVFDDRWYLAMEFLDGVTLADVQRALRRRDERLSPTVALFIAREVAQALEYAHELSDADGQPLCLVHRDVSPVNVMLLRAGAVKLLDFGIARADDHQRQSVTRGRILKGKCRYMAPEQIRGRTVDSRADIFGLGIVLWEMLTNRPLFRGTSEFDTLSSVLNAEIVPPSQIVAGLSSELDRITLRALARDPALRYESAAAMADDLDRVLGTMALGRRDLPCLIARLFDSSRMGNQPLPLPSQAAGEGGTSVLRPQPVPGDLTTGQLVSQCLRAIWLGDTDRHDMPPAHGPGDTPVVIETLPVSSVTLLASQQPHMPGHGANSLSGTGPALVTNDDPTVVGPDPALLMRQLAAPPSPITRPNPVVGSDPLVESELVLHRSASIAPAFPAPGTMVVVNVLALTVAASQPPWAGAQAVPAAASPPKRPRRRGAWAIAIATTTAAFCVWVVATGRNPWGPLLAPSAVDRTRPVVQSPTVVPPAPALTFLVVPAPDVAAAASDVTAAPQGASLFRTPLRLAAAQTARVTRPRVTVANAARRNVRVHQLTLARLFDEGHQMPAPEHDNESPVILPLRASTDASNIEIPHVDPFNE